MYNTIANKRRELQQQQKKKEREIPPDVGIGGTYQGMERVAARAAPLFTLLVEGEDRMADEFVEGTRLTVSWDRGIAPMREMEHELEVLFAGYGLEFYASGCDLFEYGRKLIFEVPVKKVHRVVIRWPDLVHIGLEKALEGLLSVYGYTCTDRGRDTTGDKERELVFRQPV